MSNGAQGVPRLHIPPYQFGSEGLHGPLQPCVCNDDKKCACPTSFPAPAAMGSAWNESLYYLVGKYDGLEARAINNLRDHGDAERVRRRLGLLVPDHQHYYIKDVVLFEENSIILLPESLESSGW